MLAAVFRSDAALAAAVQDGAVGISRLATNTSANALAGVGFEVLRVAATEALYTGVCCGILLRAFFFFFFFFFFWVWASVGLGRTGHILCPKCSW